MNCAVITHNMILNGIWLLKTFSCDGNFFLNSIGVFSDVTYFGGKFCFSFFFIFWFCNHRAHFSYEEKRSPVWRTRLLNDENTFDNVTVIHFNDENLFNLFSCVLLFFFLLILEYQFITLDSNYLTWFLCVHLSSGQYHHHHLVKSSSIFFGLMFLIYWLSDDSVTLINVLGDRQSQWSFSTVILYNAMLSLRVAGKYNRI